MLKKLYKQTQMYSIVLVQEQIDLCNEKDVAQEGYNPQATSGSASGRSVRADADPFHLRAYVEEEARARLALVSEAVVID